MVDHCKKCGRPIYEWEFKGISYGNGALEVTGIYTCGLCGSVNNKILERLESVYYKLFKES